MKGFVTFVKYIVYEPNKYRESKKLIIFRGLFISNFNCKLQFKIKLLRYMS